MDALPQENPVPAATGNGAEATHAGSAYRASASTPPPDNALARSFLGLFYPKGPWLLTAIDPDRRAIKTQTFYPGEEKELFKFLNDFNGIRNIYFSVNEPIERLTKKAERQDIKRCHWLHVDIDQRAGE